MSDNTPVMRMVPVDDFDELIAAADECAEDLEAEISASYPMRLVHKVEGRRYERDMAPVRRLRAAVARVRGE
jgi:hypothetical protein